MKVLAAFLGILFLLISGYPCCISDNCDIISTKKISEKGNEQQKDGLCSPFRACGTCIGFVSPSPQSVSAPSLQVITLSSYFGHSFKSAEAEYADRVWQPPKQVIIS